MFTVRPFGGPIVHRIFQPGPMCIGAALKPDCMSMPVRAEGIMMCVIAATVYALGKTFLWPTMLAVASERFPKGGAVAIGLMGGVGMLSAGLLGGPAIGYKQDYYASKNLQTASQETFGRYSAEEPKGFLFLPPVKGLDGAKVGVLSDQGKELANVGAALAKEGKTDPNHEKLKGWWENAKATADKDAPLV